MHNPYIPGSRSVVFDGDSLTALWPSTTWPTAVMQRSTWTNATWNDYAVGGTTTVDMVARYDRDVRPLKPDVFGNGVYILNGGTGDFCNRIGTDASAYANLKILWSKAKNDGFQVVATTIYSSCDVPGSYWETHRLSLNQLIRSNPALYDRLVPLDVLIPNVNDITVLYDKLHYTPAGNAIPQAAVEAALVGL